MFIASEIAISVSASVASAAPAATTADSVKVGLQGNASATNGSFSKMLTTQDHTGGQDNGAHAQPTAHTGNTASQANANNASPTAASSNDSGNNSGGNEDITISVVALVAAQGSNGAQASGNSAGDPGQELLALFQQILQQLIAQMSGGTADTAQGSTGTDASAAAPAPSSQKDTAQSQNTSGDALSALLAQLMQMMQQLLPQLQQAAASFDAAQQTSVGDATSAPASGNTQPSLQDLLAMLEQALQNSANGAQANASDDGDSDAPVPTAATATDGTTAATDAAASLTIKATASLTSFADFLSHTPQAANTQADASAQAQPDMQSVVSQILSLLSSHTGKPDAGAPVPANSNASVSGTSTRADDSVAATTTVAQQPAASPAAASFVKFMAAASSSPPPVADQVLVQIKSAADSGANQIRIQLSPADLGKVDVQMMTNADGKTDISITADSRSTLNMLQSEARELAAALRDVGMKADMGSLSFNLRGDGQPNQQGNPKQGAYTKAVAAVGEDNSDGTTATVGGMYRLSVTDGLDIRV